jgi:hypothetical protein
MKSSSEFANLDCLSCGQNLDVPLELSGQEIQCPVCDGPIFIKDDDVESINTEVDVIELNQELPEYDLCHQHDDVPAELQCVKCDKKWCKNCTVKPGKIHFCKICKARCEPIGEIEIPPLVHFSFWDLFKISFNTGLSGFFTIFLASLMSAFVGWLLLVNLGNLIVRLMPMVFIFGDRALGSATVTASIFVMAPWIILAVIYFGYCFHFAKLIAYEAAIGKELMPEIPRIDSFFSDTIGAFVQFSILLFIAYGPPVGIVVLLNSFGFDHWVFLFIVPILGGLIMPFLLVWVSIIGGVGALRFRFVAQSIKVFFGYYLFLATVFIIFSISFLLLLPVLISQVDEGVKSLYLLLPVISYLALYILTVVMRQLGFLYYVNRSDLGWIRADH